MAAHAQGPVQVSISRRARDATALAAKPIDIAGYWLSLSATYILVGFLWYYAAKSKIFDDGLIAPNGVKESFAGSFVADFPGTSVAWGALGIMQGVLVLGLIASLLRGEFLPHRGKDLLLGVLTGSLFVFALLAFGQNMIGEHDSAASLFLYFVGTAVLIPLVRMLPPYRSDRWLTAGDKR